jgi:hypothetical protein
MDLFSQILAHVPWWVFVLFAYLVSRGIVARKPGETTLAKLAIIPAVLLLLGIGELWQLFGFAVPQVQVWLGGIVIGTGIGMFILRKAEMVVDREHGIIHRPADMTVLPLVFLIFAVKFAFGMMSVVAPDLLQQTLFRFLDIGSSGLFGGIFLGKLSIYASHYLAAPRRSLSDRHHLIPLEDDHETT